MGLVYRHILNDVVFYIGISRGNERPYSRSSRSYAWHDLVKDNKFDVDIIYEDDDFDFIKEKEEEFIKLYGKKSDGGTLVNITDGGNSSWNKGITHDKNHRHNLSKALKGKKWSESRKNNFSNVRSIPFVFLGVRYKNLKECQDSICRSKNYIYRRLKSIDFKDCYYE